MVHVVVYSYLTHFRLGITVPFGRHFSQCNKKLMSDNVSAGLTSVLWTDVRRFVVFRLTLHITPKYITYGVT